MPAKDDVASPRTDEEPAARYHVPEADAIRRAARRVLRSGRATYPSQVAFRDAVVSVLRREDPLAVVGGQRLRRLSLDTAGVRLSVHYRERPDDRPLTACPVCGSALKPVRNRTLTGDSVVLGQQCTRCDYWTHRERRVPVRYTFSRGAASKRRAGDLT